MRVKYRVRCVCDSCGRTYSGRTKADAGEPRFQAAQRVRNRRCPNCHMPALIISTIERIRHADSGD